MPIEKLVFVYVATFIILPLLGLCTSVVCNYKSSFSTNNKFPYLSTALGSILYTISYFYRLESMLRPSPQKTIIMVISLFLAIVLWLFPLCTRLFRHFYIVFQNSKEKNMYLRMAAFIDWKALSFSCIFVFWLMGFICLRLAVGTTTVLIDSSRNGTLATLYLFPLGSLLVTLDYES